MKNIKTFGQFKRLSLQESWIDLSDDELEDSSELGELVNKFNQDEENYEVLKDDANDLFQDYLMNGGGNEKISAEKTGTLFDTAVSAEDIIYDHMMGYLILNEWYMTFSHEETDIIKNLLKQKIRKALKLTQY